MSGTGVDLSLFQPPSTGGLPRAALPEGSVPCLSALQDFLRMWDRTVDEAHLAFKAPHSPLRKSCWQLLGSVALGKTWAAVASAGTPPFVLHRCSASCRESRKLLS